MNILSMLSKLGISFSAPKWLITLLLMLRSGTQGASLSVRVVIFDATGAVFLVKHSYMKGWYFPGGGVDRGEVLVDAARREMSEEARILAKAEPQLHGVFLYNKLKVPDYVACFVVRDWVWDSEAEELPDGKSLDGEIIESGFFALDALPDGITKATRARLEEVATGIAPAKIW